MIVIYLWLVYVLFVGDEPTDCYLADLFAQLTTVIATKPSERQRIMQGQSSNKYTQYGMQIIVVWEWIICFSVLKKKKLQLLLYAYIIWQK